MHSPKVEAITLAYGKLIEQEKIAVQLSASSTATQTLSLQTLAAAAPKLNAPDRIASQTPVLVLSTEPTQSELVEKVLTTPAAAEPEFIEPTQDTETRNFIVLSVNSGFYFLPSVTPTVPIPTPVGPNDWLLGLPNNLPVDEKSSVEIRQPNSILDLTSSQTLSFPHQPNWCKSLLGRVRKQETAIAKLHQGNNGNTEMPCALVMDEMDIRKQLDFDRSAEKFVGYVDMVGCLTL